ncbi:MAG: alkaline phosphatase family protein [Phycisphaerales bacterium]|nr:alkaline phosphatase family protein [Phycisphaerales bacterium]MCB9856284.1 alkaline phosphatase family protein [Phycisphaerales bacterium]MCB9863277.1 alkaline phosphatase family protein [Phycisphaerales bacterium]
MNRLKTRRRGALIVLVAAMPLLGTRWATASDGDNPALQPMIAPPTTVVAGPMVCWNPHETSGLHVWVIRRGNGPTYSLNFREGQRKSLAEINADSRAMMMCGSFGEGLHPISIPVGKVDDVCKQDLHVALLRNSLGWNGEAGSEDFFGEATFHRIPPKGESGRYTFAFGSCSHQERFGEHQPIWSAIANEKPDCFFFIGDNIYLPSDPKAFPTTRDAVLDFYRERYNHQRMMPELQPLLRSTYCFGIWDDHDYGPNNSDSTWQWKDAALEAFKEYFPGTYGLPDAPGCFQKFSWGDVDVFLLDDRTYRDPNDSPKPDKTMFGAAQLAWLKQGLAESKAKVKLIVNGNQMLSDVHPHESWGTYFKPERDAFLRWLWDNKIGGVFFLAGDRHFAELIHKKDPKGVGPDVWELTSSPLANEHFKRGGMLGNKERVAKYIEGVNYGVVRIDTTVAPSIVRLIAKDIDGRPVIDQRVEVQK